MNEIYNINEAGSQVNWHQATQRLLRKVKENLLSYKNFEFVVRQLIEHLSSPINDLSIEITSDSISYCKYSICSNSDNDPSISEVFHLDNSDAHKCHLKIWSKSLDGIERAFSNDDIKNIIKEVIIAFWKSNLRDDKTQMISEQISETKVLIRNTIANQTIHSKYIAFYFSDLDKFGEVNNNYTQQNGDYVIMQMAAFFDEFVRKENAILIHRSGDEFIFLSFYDNPEDAILFSYTLQEKLSSINFKLKNVDIDTINKTITTGLNIYQIQSESDQISYEINIGVAEKAMKDYESGSKRYGLANIANSDITSTNQYNRLSSHYLNTSVIVAKTIPSNKVAYGNVWLNVITKHVYSELKQGNLISSIRKILDWMQLDYNNLCISSITSNKFPDYTKKCSPYDVLLAMVRGIFLHEKETNTSNSYSIFSNNEKIVLKDTNDNEIYEIENTSELKQNLSIGSRFNGSFTPVALLIKVGHNSINIPKDIFAETIIVDDRPSRGGGLPDFWEATIARLISKLDKNHNVKKIFVLGDERYAPNTVDILRKLSTEGAATDEEIENVVYKIGSTNQTLRSVMQKSLVGNVVIVKNIEELLKDYCEFITDGFNFETFNIDDSAESQHSFLQKELKLDGHSLSNEDGFRVETLSEAFPLMLEIARKASLNKQIVDQAGVSLGELIDFKVELSNPLKNPIPFYYHKDIEKFDAYFNEQFLKEEGLFGKHLSVQKKKVLNHVVETISNGDHQYATRRAILIIPNDITEESDLAPLGLVSIRLITRFVSNNHIKLSFSFTWRTVEALVGFPYSFYGSIKYSEHLTKEIIELLPSNHFEVSIDKLSYIAHSLHIFMDNYGQNIAKRIADDASV